MSTIVSTSRLSFLQHIKGLVLMLVFTSHYVVFQTIRIDALFGMQTMGWYEKALSTVGLDSFGSLTNLSSAVDFLEGHADASVRVSRASRRRTRSYRRHRGRGRPWKWAGFC